MPELDPVIHPPARLSIVALLAPLEEAEFGYIRDTLAVSDSALSKQLAHLEEAGYINIRKGHGPRATKRPRTWISLSDAGRAALAHHVTALKEMIAVAEQAPTAGR